ncbi:MAG: OmpA family protein [Paludibacteraceae bacterium]|nr:OmpA family protein [Paludibacteraceae bacterium]
MFKKALNGVQFETGKSKIKGKASFAILDDVVKVMNENPAYKLNIGGHTDNVGDPGKNMQLSKDRAAAVRAYLVEKGVDESRLAAAGYGDTVPVASNKTAKGRAENRRVAFEVEF